LAKPAFSFLNLIFIDLTIFDLLHTVFV